MIERDIVDRVEELVARHGTARVGVLGGTFDPVHVGHLALAECALEELELDLVLFVVAGAPSFKLDKDVTDPAVRLAMVRAATADRDDFLVSECEVDREGVTYTIDTLRELREALPSETELYLIVGADAFASLPLWYRAQDIAKTSRVVWADRNDREPWHASRLTPAYELAPHSVRLSCHIPKVSSTQIRKMLRAGEDPGDLLHPNVRAYVMEHGLYGWSDVVSKEKSRPKGRESKDKMKCDFAWAGTDDVKYSDEERTEVERLRASVSERLSGKRLDHSLRVAATARRMAQRYGVDPWLAEVAGLLHDWDKKLSREQQWEKARSLGVVEGDADERVYPLLHAWTAERDLPHVFPGLPVEVFAAVGKHTVGDVEMSDLDKIVYIADAIEPGREYPGVEKMREDVAKLDLDVLFAQAVRASIFSVLDTGRYLHPRAVAVWNAWCDKLHE